MPKQSASRQETISPAEIARMEHLAELRHRLDLAADDPARFLAIVDAMPKEEKESFLKRLKVEYAQKRDDEKGFAAFYELVIGKKPPAFVINEWIKPLYEARRNKRGLVIKAFRGSTKTTTLTIAYTAWRIGKEPHLANLLIQVGDDIAEDNAGQIADIIRNNDGFKKIFATEGKDENGKPLEVIVPDTARGWSTKGYEVMRADIGYEKWRTLNAKRKDPTLLGVSYKSNALIGKHPNGLLLVDDIHDEGNTSSDRELQTVHRILTSTIFPAIEASETQVIFVGTPWVSNDALQYVINTGEFEEIVTPVYREDDSGKFVYTWPERWDEEAVRRQRNLSGSVEFARMFLLNLEAANNRLFKYQSYPSSEIHYNWPIVGGVDYAAALSNAAVRRGQNDNDYFAMAYVAKLPGGGAVVVDGVLEKTTQAQAELFVNRAQSLYPNWLHAVVEGDVKGEDFISVIRRNPALRIVPMKTGQRSKGARLEKEMGPWLENGAVRISDAETPFLSELRRELNSYPLCEHDDAMDAVYWALRGMPDVLVMRDAEEALPDPESTRRGKRTTNPFLAFAR